MARRILISDQYLDAFLLSRRVDDSDEILKFLQDTKLLLKEEVVVGWYKTFCYYHIKFFGIYIPCKYAIWIGFKNGAFEVLHKASVTLVI